MPARTWILTGPPEPEWILGESASIPAGTPLERLEHIARWPPAAAVSV